MNSTQVLASFASRLRFGDIPSAVMAHAKLCLLDTIGCGLFGSTLPWSCILRETIVGLDHSGSSSIWGSVDRCSPDHAALVNGAAVHGFELDDLHARSIVHPGSVVVPAAIAAAELRGHASGAELITALIAGYEVAARVGMSVGAAHLLQGWHPTGTHGTLAAAAAAGSILGLPDSQMADALGIAGSQAAGLMSAQYGSMVKRFHAGRASQSGFYAAVLASHGYTGIRDLFEADYGGYLQTFSPRYDASRLTQGLGQKWETSAVGFKLYATNGSCHPVIDVLLEMLSDASVRPEHVERVTVHVSSATKEHVGWRYTPDSITTAQMNLSYVVAVVLKDRAAFVDQFTEKRIRDSDVLALSERVKVISDPAIDARGDSFRHAVRVEVSLRDGRTLTADRDHARGSAADPWSERDVRLKYRNLAARALTAAATSEIESRVMSLERQAETSTLLTMLASATNARPVAEA